MRSKQFSFLMAAAGVGFLCSGSLVHAQTIGPIITTTPIPLTKTDFTGGLTFTKFDQSLGTLLSVQLDVSASIQTVLSVKNNAASSSNGFARTQVTVFVNDPGGVLPVPGVDAFGQPVIGAYNVTILSPGVAYNLAPNQSMTSGTLTANGANSVTFTSAANGNIVSQFAGISGSSITLGVGTDTRTLISNNGGNTTASQVTQASATGTVTYTYLAAPPPAVPEPGMMAFALSGGAGLAGMVVRGRRRAKSTNAA